MWKSIPGQKFSAIQPTSQLLLRHALVKVLAVVCLMLIPILGLVPWSFSLSPGISAGSLASPQRLLTKSSSTGVSQEPLIVHYIWLHSKFRQPNPITFLDCVSVLSVMKNLKPDAILVHTNLPDFWPFDPCNHIISNWAGLELVPVQMIFVAGGKRIHLVEQAADLTKLKVLREYGGLVIDFDVYLINGTKFREVYYANPCVLTEEKAGKLNYGFIACQKGETGHLETGYVAEGISNRPEYQRRLEFLSSPERKHAWMDKIAHHSYLHNVHYNLDSIKGDNSSMGDLLQWIVYD
ncbi:hypothetical protein BV898_10069 [Hypsibius exemplaris]|uniref:Uncharacterized protein n=1 Tax=Hypsibius exemplaris TaxID=2072580 RepID=A0A1W0WKX9_HYPEX|nr:hypothetical protein BV898_10069 [Hypsibius exemplaris]